MKMNKLLVRKDTIFKKPSSSLYNARAATVLKKAFELSELCGVDVCIIWYDREGNLVKTWPENEEAKVRAIAERYSMLSEEERGKKRNNLSGFLNKKMIRDKKESLRKRDNKFFQFSQKFSQKSETEVVFLRSPPASGPTSAPTNVEEEEDQAAAVW
ncbi:PREDICTED: agamous-like MADS-box protein AGL93 [Brassica oleracea var. oleracea]|uniref:agamous-like MADS-box protein AGL93 n=1 Tax=Brassica oleracea var. oleracea TaxID=109376 RepID=UPI0006A6DE11|nr:PREDICTED: agamous-like MADS-box protein AGL93 [Brassica oleracea var. oleracea]